MSNYFLNGKTGNLTKFENHKPPEFKEVKNNEFVQYGYEKDYRNRYPDYLLSLFNKSSKHNSICLGKNKFIVGNGWEYDKAPLKFEDKVKAKKFKRWLQKSKITNQLSLDRVIFGGWSCEIIPSKDLESITLSHIDFSKIRQFKQETKEDELKYGYTSDWSTKRPETNEDFEILYPFDWDKENISKDKRYIVYYKEYRPDLGVYPLPEYIGAVPYIEADYEVGNFVLNNVKNGFSGSYLVNFYNGTPTEEQQREISERWNQTKQGSDNAGKPILSFNENTDNGVEVTPLPANGQDDRYINLNKQIQTEIYTGHQFNPSIIGISDGNGFNNNSDEIRIASELFQSMYVNSEQGYLEDFINSVSEFNGLKTEWEIIKLETITEQISESTLLQIATVDELRQKAGLPQLSKDETVTKTVQMSSDIEAVHFENCGVSDIELEFIDEREFSAVDLQDAKEQGLQFKNQYFATQLETTILTLLLGGASTEDIAKSIDKTIPETNVLIANLKTNGSLDSDNNVTDKGQSEIKENEVFVVYKYALRNDAPPTSTGSRDFCVRMTAQSRFKSWTFEDIERLNNGQGLDVFTSRGGFYNNPRTGVNTPYCRHVWKQRLVRRK